MIAASLIALPGCAEVEEETLGEADQKAQEKSDPSDKGGEEEPVNPIDEAK